MVLNVQWASDKIFGLEFGPCENKGGYAEKLNGEKSRNLDRTKKSPDKNFGSIQIASSLYRLIFVLYYPYAHDIGPYLKTGAYYLYNDGGSEEIF